MLRKTLAICLAGILVLGAATVFTAPGQRALETLSLLQGLTSVGQRQADPANAELISFQALGKDHIADFWRVSEAQRGGIVLVPGASPQGRVDSRLRAFAELLAEHGFLVMVPEIPALRELDLRPEDHEIVAASAQHLAEVTGKPVGLFAVSYASGPAMLAALDERVASDIGYVITLGGYYDSFEALRFFTTGAFRDPETSAWRFLEPNRYGKWVFVLSNARRMENPRDAELLRAIAFRKLDDPAAATFDLYMQLSPQGQAVIALLANGDPEAFDDLFEGLPEAIQADISTMDISSRDLSGFTSKVFLVHGRDDPIIPYSESVAFDRALPDDQAELVLLDSLAHVNLDSLNPADAWTLTTTIYGVLQARDETPE